MASTSPTARQEHLSNIDLKAKNDFLLLTIKIKNLIIELAIISNPGDDFIPIKEVGNLLCKLETVWTSAMNEYPNLWHHGKEQNSTYIVPFTKGILFDYNLDDATDAEFAALSNYADLVCDLASEIITTAKKVNYCWVDEDLVRVKGAEIRALVAGWEDAMQKLGQWRAADAFIEGFELSKAYHRIYIEGLSELQ
ncbi:hypothetical protein RUND412_011676 [Rhizina undulata]